jgi:CheY-like chemotaxis protein
MADHSPPGVLVVDDQADILALLQTVLRHYGFTVWLADNGPTALSLYRQNRSRISVVLLDVAMPEWDGPRTLRALQGVNPDLICCFVTGESPRPTAAELRELGAALVVRKPFEPADLARQLWTLVGADDRRTAPRYELQSTRVAVGAGLEPSHVVQSWVSDQSPDGLGLRLPEKLGDVGAILSIRPADAADDTPWVPVQVRHCRPDPAGGGWTVGCCFLHPAAQSLPLDE